MANHTKESSLSETAYQSAGKPRLNKPVFFEIERLCGSCRRVQDVAPAKKILTSQFGSWEDIVTDPRGGRWLCLPCAWAYRDISVRRKPSLISADTMTHPSVKELREGVLTGPIPADTAVVIPTSGKRVLLPKAHRGALTFDGGVISWTRRDRTLLDVAVSLRARGIGEKELMESSPPIRVLLDTDPAEHEDIFTQWSTLTPLRRDKVRAPLFLLLSRNGDQRAK